MKFGLDITTTGEYADVRKLAGLAAEAEAAGWDSFFIWDGLLAIDDPTEPNINPWIALTAIGLHAHRIKLGAFLTPLPRRRPWQVARETVPLDQLSHRRLIFGAGLGFLPREFTAVGPSLDPVS